MIVPQTVDFSDMGREPVTVIDRGVLQQPIVGDQRDDELVFEFWATEVSETLVAIMKPAASGGKVSYFYAQVKIPNNDADTTGETWTSSACFLQDGIRRVPASGPQSCDRYQVRITVRGGWTKATY